MSHFHASASTPYGDMLFARMVTRMTRQLTVPKCDGPILLLLDVSSCCAGTMSAKTPRSAGVAASWARLLCRCGIDPPAVSESPVVAVSGLSSTCSVTYSGVCARGRGSLLSRGCSIDSVARPHYLRLLSHAGIRLGVINAHAALFNQDHQSIAAFTGTGCICCDNVNKNCHQRYDKLSGLMVTWSIFCPGRPSSTCCLQSPTCFWGRSDGNSQPFVSEWTSDW